MKRWNIDQINYDWECKPTREKHTVGAEWVKWVDAEAAIREASEAARVAEREEIIGIIELCAEGREWFLPPKSYMLGLIAKIRSRTPAPSGKLELLTLRAPVDPNHPPADAMYMSRDDFDKINDAIAAINEIASRVNKLLEGK